MNTYKVDFVVTNSLNTVLFGVGLLSCPGPLLLLPVGSLISSYTLDLQDEWR